MRRHVVILSIVFLGVLAALPWVLYEIGLGNINRLPTLSESPGLTDAEATKLWGKLKEVGPVKVEKLNPYKYVTYLFGSEAYESYTGGRLAWFVARNHNAENINNKRSIYWHLSGAALTIWLTRNWNTEQLLTKAQEIMQRKETTSNTSLNLTRGASAPLAG